MCNRPPGFRRLRQARDDTVQGVFVFKQIVSEKGLIGYKPITTRTTYKRHEELYTSSYFIYMGTGERLQTIYNIQTLRCIYFSTTRYSVSSDIISKYSLLVSNIYTVWKCSRIPNIWARPLGTCTSKGLSYNSFHFRSSGLIRLHFIVLLEYIGHQSAIW